MEPGSGLTSTAVALLSVALTETVLGQIKIQEKYQNKWFADMSPICPIVLGPFETNEAALRAEIFFLDTIIQNSTIPLVIPKINK